MNQGLIPHRYAKALYKFVLEKGDAEKMYALMKHVSAAFATQPRLQAVMANPYVPADDKTRLLITAAGSDAAADACYADFLRLLHDNRRIEFMRDIALAYMDIYRKANNIHLVNVVTASKLPDMEIKRLRELVEKHLDGASMEFSNSIDAGLIGGFVININSERLDASVSNELKQLRLKLLSNN